MVPTRMIRSKEGARGAQSTFRVTPPPSTTHLARARTSVETARAHAGSRYKLSAGSSEFPPRFLAWAPSATDAPFLPLGSPFLAFGSFFGGFSLFFRAF